VVNGGDSAKLLVMATILVIGVGREVRSRKKKSVDDWLRDFSVVALNYSPVDLYYFRYLDFSYLINVT